MHKTPSKKLCALGRLELAVNGSSGGDQQRRWPAARWWLQAAAGRVEEEKGKFSGPLWRSGGVLGQKRKEPAGKK
ncbi:hypothetical protein Droror1_Dr00020403 [Drosera rotundifolia]